MELMLEVLQWVFFFMLFASRAASKRENKQLRADLLATEGMVDDLWRESVNALLNDCCYCSQSWLWSERTQLEKGGAWVHERESDGRLVFCHLTAPRTDEGN